MEGLRAIAIVAVLLCHAGIPIASGGYVGVDIFFVISGFLITRLLLAELERTGTVSLLNFYARRARRLLPLLFLVLATVVVGSRLFLSPVQATEVSGDVVSSAFFSVNWHFAAGSVDYFAQGADPSPVQHIWSLAIEEQFYLVWPTLILLATMPFLWRGFSPRPVLWVAVLLIAAASFAIGLGLTADQPNAAYFSTLGRAWELGLGAAVALLGAVPLPRLAGAALAWAGAGAILYAVVGFDSTTPFPGSAALAPTLGTAALIVAGGVSTGAGRLLSLRPVRYVGRISYSWYLWHWPALIFAAAVWGALSQSLALAVLGASLLPTVLSHHWIEEPLRRSGTVISPPARSLAVGAGCMAAAALGGLALIWTQPAIRTAPSDEVEGAAALASQPRPQQRADAVRPNPFSARDDRSRMYEDGCLVGTSGTRSNRCEYGDRDGRRTMVLFGDSHAMQYFPAIEKLAEKHHWRLIALAKAECFPGEVSVRSETTGREYSECDSWRVNALRRIDSIEGPATVLVSGATEYTPVRGDGEALDGGEGTAQLESGYVATLEQLRRAGKRVAVIKDIPAAEDDVPSCVSKEMANLQACSFRRHRDWADEFDADAARRARAARLVDVTDAVCPHDTCRAVIGNALVYRDRQHLSATFARTLAPRLEAGLRRAKLI
ncbi:MAG TPA: acyltransferase family protein [Solirubrobacterales bacterium]|nr:acyltransferase family protein [Solirubrobacterales bacterium]